MCRSDKYWYQTMFIMGGKTSICLCYIAISCLVKVMTKIVVGILHVLYTNIHYQCVFVWNGMDTHTHTNTKSDYIDVRVVSEL